MNTGFLGKKNVLSFSFGDEKAVAKNKEIHYFNNFLSYSHIHIFNIAVYNSLL
jgi:uncharacterized membrane protein YobD (UPF0266 family)